MIIPAELLPLSSLWLAVIPSVIALVVALLGINWQAMRDHRGTHHFFLGSIVALTLLWSLNAGILPGLHFHLLALTSITLLMGWRLALLAGFCVQLLLVIMGKLWWGAVAYQFVLAVMVPVLFTYAFWLLVYKRLPHNPFVYILVAGFLNAGLTQAITDIVQSVAIWIQDIYPFSKIWHDYLRYLPMMMFPEGVVNGMFITGMVVFHSRWLSTFDENSYFN